MKILFTPDWFVGKDLLIDFFSFIVLISFFYLSLKSYRMSKKKNILYLGSGFLFVAVAQLAFILTKLVLYYDTTFTQSIGQAVITYHVLQSVDFFYYLGIFTYKLLTLVGLFIIYRLPLKKLSKSDVFLAAYFILISSLLSVSFYYVFHMTVLIITALIISNYLKVYGKNNNRNTRILIIGFLLFAFSHMVFSLSSIGAVFVAANVIELISFFVFLSVIVKIIRASKPY
jgi:hypothetical protein